MKGSQSDMVNKLGDWSLHRRLPSAIASVECESQSLADLIRRFQNKICRVVPRLNPHTIVEFPCTILHYLALIQRFRAFVHECTPPA
jgi:hypothetical protein